MLDVNKNGVAQFPAPVLAEAAKPVDSITEEIRALADSMVDLMILTKGVGLAGPQVGIGLRIFVISVDGTKENAKVYINPEITTDGPLEAYDEGCLSIPGVYAKIKRYKKCTITATDLDGNEFTEEAEGLLSRALQHEYDHLEGTLIKDRMSRVQTIAARKQLKRLQKEFQGDS